MGTDELLWAMMNCDELVLRKCPDVPGASLAQVFAPVATARSCVAWELNAISPARNAVTLVCIAFKSLARTNWPAEKVAGVAYAILSPYKYPHRVVISITDAPAFSKIQKLTASDGTRV